MADAWLALESGECFAGQAVAAVGRACGELVFNTAMSGYQEVLTDPSYQGQLVTFTCPHIGNVGFNDDDDESLGYGPAGFVLRTHISEAIHWRNTRSMQQSLAKRGCVGIAGVDTRHLTQLIRSRGAVRACIASGPGQSSAHAIAAAKAVPAMLGQNLTSGVSIAQSTVWEWPSWGTQKPEAVRTVVVMDFGVKRSILRCLVSHGCKVLVVPANTTSQAILALKPAGVLLSNGPGDPAACTEIIAVVQRLIAARLPLAGVCLGYQLLALALGAKTEKMRFGHHGVNHPVQHLASGRIMITSQNHGFVVAEASMPETLQLTHRSLFDGTVQGFKHRDLPIRGVQGHPEAGPGPTEWTAWLKAWCDACEVTHA